MKVDAQYQRSGSWFVDWPQTPAQMALSSIVGTPISCVFRLVVLEVPTCFAPTLGAHDPMVVPGGRLSPRVRAHCRLCSRASVEGEYVDVAANGTGDSGVSFCNCYWKIPSSGARASANIYVNVAAKWGLLNRL